MENFEQSLKERNIEYAKRFENQELIDYGIQGYSLEGIITISKRNEEIKLHINIPHTDFCLFTSYWMRFNYNFKNQTDYVLDDFLDKIVTYSNQFNVFLDIQKRSGGTISSNPPAPISPSNHYYTMQQTIFQETIEAIKSLLDKNNITYNSYENNLSGAIIIDSRPNIEIITIGKKDVCIYFRIHSPHWKEKLYDVEYDRPYSLDKIFDDFMKARKQHTESNPMEIAREKVLAMQDASMEQMLDIINSTTPISAVQPLKTIIEKELKEMKYFVEEIKVLGADGNFREEEYIQKRDEYNNHPHHIKLKLISNRINELLSESFLIKD